MRKTSIWTMILVSCALLASPSGVRADDALPSLPNAKALESKELPDGGRRQSFQTSESPASLVQSYASALTNAGWTITRQGASGGKKGSGGEIVANHDGRHLVLQAGGPDGKTFLSLCVWPEPPANDYCG